VCGGGGREIFCCRAPLTSEWRYVFDQSFDRQKEVVPPGLSKEIFAGASNDDVRGYSYSSVGWKECDMIRGKKIDDGNATRLARCQSIRSAIMVGIRFSPLTKSCVL